ncbi:MAG: IS66 family insertion sequence element accessory protein TnpB [Hyphomicrobiales bacterium]
MGKWLSRDCREVYGLSKRIEGAGFVWQRMTDGVITINRSQVEALFDGLDWQRVVPRHTRKPIAV